MPGFGADSPGRAFIAMASQAGLWNPVSSIARVPVCSVLPKKLGHVPSRVLATQMTCRDKDHRLFVQDSPGVLCIGTCPSITPLEALQSPHMPVSKMLRLVQPRTSLTLGPWLNGSCNNILLYHESKSESLLPIA